MRKISLVVATGLLVVLVAGLLPTALAQNASQVMVSGSGASPFPDVPADSVNAEAIGYLKTLGVVQGYPDLGYHPKDEITRSQFMKIVMASKFTDMNRKNCFPDVKDEWFAPFVCEAQARGIVHGRDDGTFGPGEKITFAEASKIITKAYGLTEGQSGEHWFKPYVKALEAKSDIPLSIEFFNQNFTRDAMAEMIYRLKGNITDKPSRSYDEVVGDDFVTFNSCEDLQKRFVEQQKYHEDGTVRLPGTLIPPMDPISLQKSASSEGALPMVAPTASDSGRSTLGNGDMLGASNDFSTTNLQVNSVDEADVVKNDGKYIYIIKNGELRIVEAYPAENLKELVTFSLGDKGETFTPYEMYVDGNTLTVIGVDYFQSQPIPMDSLSKIVAPGAVSSAVMYPKYNTSRTKVFVLDVTNRTKPTILRSVAFDGHSVTSRKVGGTLYLVMTYSYSPVVYSYVLPGVVDGSSSAVGMPDARSVGQSFSASVPQMFDTKNGKEEVVVPCSQIRVLPKEHNWNYVIAAAIPLNDKTKEVSRSVVVGNSNNVYASQNNLYITTTDYGGGFYRKYSDYGTSIYRFALGNGTVEFKSKGKVPGQLLNQFSMDESNGYFRIVTTKNESVPGSQINSNVYVLDMGLNLAGKIEQIAPGEKLYSARFMGNKGYLVSFKRVDPFFVLDLSIPVSPKIVGELKIPGFSEYLEPYDDTHILGFGYDVDPAKVTADTDFLPYDAIKGMKLSLFDVSDFSHPKEMFKEVIGDQGTSSEVLYNHKALLFDKGKQLLSFPVTVYQRPDSAACTDFTYSTCPTTSCQKVCVPSSCTDLNGVRVCTPTCNGVNSCVNSTSTYAHPVFNGAYVYTLNLTEGFKLKGKVTHLTADEQQSLLDKAYDSYYGKIVQRVLYIGENLYTVSQAAVKANALSDLSEKKVIDLAGSVLPIYYEMAM